MEGREYEESESFESGGEPSSTQIIQLDYK